MDEQLELIKELYVNNGEYEFSNAVTANIFAKDLYWAIHDSYSSGGFHHKFDTIEEFIHSHHVDNEAFWLYEDKYSS